MQEFGQLNGDLWYATEILTKTLSEENHRRLDVSVCVVLQRVCVRVCSLLNQSSNPSLCHCITLGPFHNLLSPQFSFLLLHHLFITPLTSLLAPLNPRSTGPSLHFHRLAALKNSFSFLGPIFLSVTCWTLCDVHFSISPPPSPPPPPPAPPKAERGSYIYAACSEETWINDYITLLDGGGSNARLTAHAIGRCFINPPV